MGNLAVHRLLLDKHTHIIHFLLWQVLIQFILCLFLRLHTHNCSLLTLSAITHPRNFGTRGRVCQRPSLDLGMGPWVLFKSFISFWLTMVWFENQLLVVNQWLIPTEVDWRRSEATKPAFFFRLLRICRFQPLPSLSVLIAEEMS